MCTAEECIQVTTDTVQAQEAHQEHVIKLQPLQNRSRAGVDEHDSSNTIVTVLSMLQ
jgi:hypothetical protein